MWKEILLLGRRLSNKTSIHRLRSLRTLFKIFIIKSKMLVDSSGDMIFTEKAGSNILNPPASVRGMKSLNVDLFKKTIEVPFITVPIEKISQAMPVLKKYILKMRNFQPVNTSKDCLGKVVYLDPNKVESFSRLKQDEKLKFLNLNDSNIGSCNLELRYENWDAHDILKAVLPTDKESMSGYSVIGHICHLNLRDHLLDYKFLIGQVLLDKNKQARTIINKAENIDTTFRTFQIELLAGENDMMVKVKENNCTYEFDFSKVYWNPRLGAEHERIVKLFKSGDVLYDVFAGVGPFSIPSAKKKCIVWANDLNPESFKWLKQNAKLNKVSERIKIFNKDGSVFISEDVRADLKEQWASSDQRKLHIVMNLPAMAVEFLKYFQGLMCGESKPDMDKLPIVHIYCFVKNADNREVAAIELVESHLGSKLDNNIKSVHLVRTVSNRKEMMRVSFVLSEKVLFGLSDEIDEPALKKRKEEV